MTTLAEFNPVIAADCLNVVVGCMSVNNGEAVIVYGSEQPTVVSTVCFVRTFWTWAKLRVSLKMYAGATGDFFLLQRISGSPALLRDD